jgi:hypothetical protein
MDEDILIPLMFFLTVIVLALGIPLMRAFIRQKDRTALATPLTPELAARLDRLESTIETVAVEVERMAEGQRFTTRLLAEGAVLPLTPPARDAATARVGSNEVNHG